VCDMRRRIHVWAVDWVGLGLVGKRDMCHMRRRIHVSYEEEDTCVSYEEDTCVV